MSLNKINYEPGDILTAKQVNDMQDAIINTERNIAAHISDTTNPHNVTAKQIGAARIAYGSYVGTGTAGSNNANSLTFDFVPKIVFVLGGTPRFADCGDSTTHVTNQMTLINGITMAYTKSSSGGCEGKLMFKWEGNTVTWWHADTKPQAESQLNQTNVIYHYVAMG